MAILKINGNERQFKAGSLPATIAALLDHLNLNAATVVAEIDGNIVERDKFAETKLTDGQSIELVRFVGGG
ncbi:MAG TPA: sulfur carrier protein ThiS [Phycisphaerales bacterium]|nr:sulfur carrier protein ThiS [Phycisphaerales bacterium]